MDHPQECPFKAYLDWHMKHGFVFSTPEFFAMGRPVMRYRPEAEITEPTFLFNPEDCDTWYIFALAGNMQKAWSIMPWPLEWIAFERLRGGIRELTFARTETLKRLCPPILINADEAVHA